MAGTERLVNCVIVKPESHMPYCIYIYPSILITGTFTSDELNKGIKTKNITHISKKKAIKYLGTNTITIKL